MYLCIAVCSEHRQVHRQVCFQSIDRGDEDVTALAVGLCSATVLPVVYTENTIMLGYLQACGNCTVVIALCIS